MEDQGLPQVNLSFERAAVPFPRGSFSNVGHPQLVWTGAREMALNQISDGDPWWSSLTALTVRRQANKASAVHQQPHSVVDNMEPLPID